MMRRFINPSYRLVAQVLALVLGLQLMLPGVTGLALVPQATVAVHEVCTAEGLATVTDQAPRPTPGAIKCGFCLIGATGFGGGCGALAPALTVPTPLQTAPVIAGLPQPEPLMGYVHPNAVRGPPIIL